MRLLNIRAQPAPTGNQIEVLWELPPGSPFSRVRVVRREGAYPTEPNPGSPKAGVVVPELPGQSAVTDAGLQGGQVYYYALFPYNTANADGTIVISDPAAQIDSHNRAQALAITRHDTAGQMYDLLPALYHRYDTVLPRTPSSQMSAEDKGRGQLRRFLDLPGGQLDAVYSYAQSILNTCDVDHVDGRLLPLLAQWVGWRTDFGLGLDEQRNQIRNATAWYETIGILPVVQATVKRITKWESRTKEYVHNVFLSNRPEQLNLWLRSRNNAGVWGDEAAQPLSLDFNYEGRAAVVRLDANNLWLCYHTLRQGRWELWFKTAAPATTPPNSAAWTSSQPIPGLGSESMPRHPSAALQGNRLWLFWDVYAAEMGTWGIHYRTQVGGTWEAIQPLGSPNANRRQPAAIADDAGGVWLFWLERAAGDAGWQLKYNRHNGTAWELATDAVVPTGAVNPEDDLFVLFHTDPATPRIWVFWVSQSAISGGNPEATRATVFYCSKQAANAAVNTDWSAVRHIRGAGLPAGDFHDRGPAAMSLRMGNIELFFSSNREGNPAIWRALVNGGTGNINGEAKVTGGLYAHRAPVVVPFQGNTLLLYRSNQSVTYTSQVYGAASSVDFRYAGSTTADVRDKAKLSARATFNDFQRYTYDTGQPGGPGQPNQRTNDDWYARDTVGVFAQPGGADPQTVANMLSRLRLVLGEFMPLTQRAVFIAK